MRGGYGGVGRPCGLDGTTLSAYCDPMNVGVRELKAHLSEYIDRAARGEVICVTDRGRARAILSATTNNSRIEEGVRDGWLRAGSGAPPVPIVRHVGQATVATTVEDDRENF